MADHLLIIGIVILLLIGISGAVFLRFKAIQYSDKTLMNIFQYHSLYNLLVFCALIYIYLYVNLGEEFILTANPRILWLARFSNTLLFGLLIFSLMKIQLGFLNIDISMSIKAALWIVLIIFTVLYILMIYSISEVWPVLVLKKVFLFLNNNLIALEIPILLYGIFRVNRRSKVYKPFIIFNLIYIIRYVLLGLAFFSLNQNDAVKRITIISLLIIYSFLPLIWYRLVRSARKKVKGQDHSSRLAHLINQFDISKREVEIIELILEGLSNKEIADRLHISLHTVKNHVYNIYGKLNINSRYMLFSIMENENQVK